MTRRAITLRLRIFVISCCGLLLVLAAMLTFVAFRRPQGRPAMTVTFVGFTNNAGGARVASFSISNDGARTVQRSGGYRIQIPAGDHWTNLTDGFLPAKRLRAGTSEVVMLSAPTNQSSWRASFSGRYDEGLVARILAELLIEGQKLGVPLRHRRVGYSVHSDSVQNSN